MRWYLSIIITEGYKEIDIGKIGLEIFAVANFHIAYYCDWEIGLGKAMRLNNRLIVTLGTFKLVMYLFLLSLILCKEIRLAPT